jgi:hypothetical protein
MKAQRLAEGETDVANGKAAFEAQMGNDRFKYSKLKLIIMLQIQIKNTKGY